MSQPPTICPICLSAYETTADVVSRVDGYDVACSVCGNFSLAGDAWNDWLNPECAEAAWWLPHRRAALSHALLTRVDVPIDGEPITSAVLDAFKRLGAQLPLIVDQKHNAIRIIGDHERETGAPMGRVPAGFYARVGCASPSAAGRLLVDMNQFGLLGTLRDPENASAPFTLHLTPNGWTLWQADKIGRVALDRGLVVLKFGDRALDDLVENVLRPAVAKIKGLSLHRLDDPEIAPPGGVDDIMRDAIRRAAFVMLHLSHANHGAYWAAGLAEGLYKPVVYLCDRVERKKRPSGIDAKHCAMVVCDPNDVDRSAHKLGATLRVLLNRL